MKCLFLISVLCVLVAVNRAAVSRGTFKDPKHPGKCVIDGTILLPGEEAPQPHSCGKMFCENEGMVTFHSCGLEATPPGFKLGKATLPNAPYPDCCKREFIKIN